MYYFNQIVLSALLIASSCATSASTFGQFVGDDLSLPYQALVLKDQATVHSGPGRVHYATEKMPQGSAVQVYRHDPGGWCQIRPVKDSFSLIPEAGLELLTKSIGRIKEDGTQAWVGTALGPVEKPLWQIKLRKDEKVKILGEVSWPNAEGHSTNWYQIAPPAGEFRWIRMSDIQLPPGHQVDPRSVLASQTNPVRSATPIRTNQVQSYYELESNSNPALAERDSVPYIPPASMNPNAVPYDVPSADLLNESVSQATYQAPIGTQSQVNLGWRRATQPVGSINNNKGFVSQNKAADANAHSSHRGIDVRTPRTPLHSNPNIRVASADTARSTFAGDLRSTTILPTRNLAAPLDAGLRSQRSLIGKTVDQLDLLLTEEMLKASPATWQLNDLAEAAKTISMTGSYPEKENAGRLLSKIDNCQKIRQGYIESTNVSLGGSGASDADIELSTRFDAHGWLNQMIRDGGQSQPTYVLQDDSGNITHHIAPAPGLNLHRYLKSKVGVVGQRGFHTRYKLDHVTVHQVIEIEKRK